MSADVSRNARCGAADNRHTTGGAVPRPERIGDGHDRRARNCCRNGQFGRRGHPRRRRGRRRYRLGDRVPLHDRPTVARRHRDARFLGDRPGGPHRLRRTGGRSGRPPRSRRSSAFRRRPVRGGRHVPRRRGPRGHRVRPRRADADRRHPSDAVERPHGSSSRVRARTHRAAAGDPGVRGHRVPAMARIRTRPAGRRCRRRVRPGGRVARRLGDAHRRRGGLARADAAVRGRDRAQFDHLVTRHVLDDLTGRTPGFDPFDPAVLEALTMLRRNCSAAKEALSTDTEAVIPSPCPTSRRMYDSSAPNSKTSSGHH